MFFLVIPFVVYAGGRWYDNGTLHSASIAEWNRATYANKLVQQRIWHLVVLR
jgi:ABC-type microcin C transport system permease subunit YejB